MQDQWLKTDVDSMRIPYRSRAVLGIELQSKVLLVSSFKKRANETMKESL